MNVSTAITLSNQLTLQERLEVATNNIANMTNHGFQEDKPLFAEYLGNPDAYERPSYVNDISSWRNIDTGPIERTENPTHLAISGKGYFSVLTPDGQQYTRGGAFVINSQGELTTPEGYPVLSLEGGNIAIPADTTELNIGRDGTISNQTGVIGRVGIFAFSNEFDVIRHRNNLLTPGGAVTPAENFSVIQGALEGSNVDAMKSTAELVNVQRLYAMNQRLIEADMQLQEKSIQQLLTLPNATN